MKKLYLPFFLLTALIGTFSAHSAALQGDIDAGEQKAQSCTSCHNPQLAEAAGYPKLEGQHASYTYKQLQEFKLGMTSNGEEGRVNPVMGTMAQALSEQDMLDLAAYYAAQRMSPNTSPENVIEAGRKLYMGGDMERGIAACTACHGPRGVGQSLAKFPRISGQYANYLQTQLEQFRSGARANDMNGMMRDVAKKLSDEDIAILASYLGGLH